MVIFRPMVSEPEATSVLLKDGHSIQIWLGGLGISVTSPRSKSSASVSAAGGNSRESTGSEAAEATHWNIRPQIEMEDIGICEAGVGMPPASRRLGNIQWRRLDVDRVSWHQRALAPEPLRPAYRLQRRRTGSCTGTTGAISWKTVFRAGSAAPDGPRRCDGVTRCPNVPNAATLAQSCHPQLAYKFAGQSLDLSGCRDWHKSQAALA